MREIQHFRDSVGVKRKLPIRVCLHGVPNVLKCSFVIFEVKISKHERHAPKQYWTKKDRFKTPVLLKEQRY